MSNRGQDADLGLLPWCTKKQAEVLQTWHRVGTLAGAARELGLAQSTVSRQIQAIKAKAAFAGYSPGHFLATDEIGAGPVPAGYGVNGTSTLYGPDGEVKAQWVKTKNLGGADQDLVEAAIEALNENVERAIPRVGGLDCPGREDLFSLYPVGDHHFGMLSWHEETGDDYDTSIGESLLCDAVNRLVEGAEPSGIGILALMGDFLHYDTYETVTPASKNHLDSDTRFPNVVRVAMKAVRYAIERLLDKHELVKVIVAAGNHDPASSVWLREALFCVYEREDRVDVERSPGAFQYVKLGNVLLAFHHGDKTKMDKLPLVIAHDRAIEWGETKFRYAFTGHVHHESVKEFPGLRVESLRILPPTDAWAHAAGYRAGREMRRIDFHVHDGEVGRQIFIPHSASSRSNTLS